MPTYWYNQPGRHDWTTTSTNITWPGYTISGTIVSNVTFDNINTTGSTLHPGEWVATINVEDVRWGDYYPPPIDADTHLYLRATPLRQERLQAMWGRWQSEAYWYWKKIEQEEANERAKSLLLELLDAKQRQELETHRYFHVQTADGERTYRIDYGHSGNVKLIEQGRPVASFCIHSYEDMPDYDEMALQKLMLESDEQEFLRIANRAPIGGWC
jgi:hypothetical protein